MDRKKTKAGAILLLLGIAMTGNAQSYVTYNHDSSKKNQITVMEIGSGSLVCHQNCTISYCTAVTRSRLPARTNSVFVPRQESELTIKWNMPKPSTLP